MKKKGLLSWRWKAFLVLVVLAVLFATVLRMSISWLNTLPPLAQFFLVSFPILLTLAFLLSGMKFKLNKLIGNFFLLFLADLVIPALLVKLDGTLANADLVGASAEAVTRTIWFWIPTDILIWGEPLQWYFVYPISIIIFGGIAILFLTKKEFNNAIV